MADTALIARQFQQMRRLSHAISKSVTNRRSPTHDRPLARLARSPGMSRRMLVRYIKFVTAPCKPRWTIGSRRRRRHASRVGRRVHRSPRGDIAGIVMWVAPVTRPLRSPGKPRGHGGRLHHCGIVSIRERLHFLFASDINYTVNCSNLQPPLLSILGAPWVRWLE
jgi:hypothetical protein